MGFTLFSLPLGSDFYNVVMKSVFKNEEYIVFALKSEELLDYSEHIFFELVDEIRRCGASMVYTDYYLQKADGSKVANPLIDYLPGALRDDFDFGGLVCVRLADYRRWTEVENADGRVHSDLINGQSFDVGTKAGEGDYRFGNFYSLRLFLSLQDGITHIPRQLYGIKEYDPRLSGEKQFDYVNPRNREVQVEMEQVLTVHLKRNGLWLEQRTNTIEDKDLSCFTIEASVVIPVLDRVATVMDAVHSALSQKTDFEYNVIVVDNFSTDGTYETLCKLADKDLRLKVLRPERAGLGIGGCWNLAIYSEECGRYAVQLDSDDVYSGEDTLQRVVDVFRMEKPAMVIGSYKMTDFEMRPIPPGVVDHREWTDGNGHNNALRINGLGAPRAFCTKVLREVGGFPDVSYGEDYAVGLRITREYKIGRIYEPIYNCRRWGGNSDAALDIEKVNKNNYYKDSLRSAELLERMTLIQKEQWTDAAERYAALEKVDSRVLAQFADYIDKNRKFDVLAQYNPSRAVSSFAKTDAESIAKRPCFLCRTNRPEQQRHLGMNLLGERYDILLNPFPIFPKHFTLTCAEHKLQEMNGSHLEQALRFADIFRNYVVFFNGPRSGASAPDHYHLQMGCKGFLPIEKDYLKLPKLKVGERRGSIFFMPTGYLRSAVIIDSDSVSDTVSFFESIHDRFTEGVDMNLLCWKQNNRYITIMIPRSKHRPKCYFAEGEEQMRISPGTVDLGGIYILPDKRDYDRADISDLIQVLDEVTLCEDALSNIRYDMLKMFNGRQREIAVGLMSEEKVQVKFEGTFYFSQDKDECVSGLEEFVADGEKIRWRDNLYDELYFSSKVSVLDTFEVRGVTIGVDFHWQKKENQRFRGALRLVVEADKITVINVIGIEDYLYSVIASEMSGKGSLEFLKAHAVISRSWLMARPTLSGGDIRKQDVLTEISEDGSRYVKWYDRDDHSQFDVCADDHCQRYQGLVRSNDVNVARAIDRTWGQTLMYGGKVCDARFSKCCGGVSERFSACWASEDFDYLQPVRDTAEGVRQEAFIANTLSETGSLEEEYAARAWIESEPEAFCNTDDAALLSKVLNDYDTTTKDFYRWKVEYDAAKLAELIARRSGFDFGDIVALKPVKRGASGRIIELRIEGTKLTKTIGKELEIRRTLSESHLYSSAFVVDTEGVRMASDGKTEIPARWILKGAGWGHGVGLCQIGAAYMGEQGYSYKEILAHYFRGSSIEKQY